MKNPFYLSIILSFFAVLSCKSNLEETETLNFSKKSESSSSVKNNQVDFYTKGNLHITGFLFNNQKDNYCITPGQTWDGLSMYYPSKNHFQLVVYAGRKNSKYVTNWYNNIVGKNNALISIGNKSHVSVNHLNFAFKGILRFHYNGYEFHLNVAIAQGHPYSWAPHNYWYIGDRNIHLCINNKCSTTIIHCTSNPKYTIQIKLSPGNSGNHSFNIEVI